MEKYNELMLKRIYIYKKSVCNLSSSKFVTSRRISGKQNISGTLISKHDSAKMRKGFNKRG